MFDAKKAFSALTKKAFSDYGSLRTELISLTRTHKRDLPPGVGPREMMEIAAQKGWVHQTGAGFEIRVED